MRVVTCWDSDSAWAKTVMGGRSCESGILRRELIRSLSFCTAGTKHTAEVSVCETKREIQTHFHIIVGPFIQTSSLSWLVFIHMKSLSGGS